MEVIGKCTMRKYFKPTPDGGWECPCGNRC